MVFASNIRFGGANITSDIMQAFQISFNEAERIKTLHGGLIITNLDDNELIELSLLMRIKHTTIMKDLL